MAGRASVFSHPEIIRLLGESFIPVADNCGYTQTQQDAKGEFFRQVAEQGHYGGRTKPTATRQGLYACTVEGELLASINTRDADQVLGTLREGLDRWRQRPAASAPPHIPATYQPDPRLNWSYPEGGLVLKVTVRDLPRESGEPDPRHNIDFAWFTGDEARSLVPADPLSGRSYLAPAFFTKRIARCHLIDTVRGQSPRWREENVQNADLTLLVEEVTPGRVHLRLEGEMKNEAAPTFDVNPFSGQVVDKPRGVALKLLGYLRFDRQQETFEAFDAVAAGPRWGATTYNARFDDPGPAPIGFALEIASGDPTERVPPAAIGSGYFA